LETDKVALLGQSGTFDIGNGLSKKRSLRSRLQPLGDHMLDFYRNLFADQTAYGFLTLFLAFAFYTEFFFKFHILGSQIAIKMP